MILTLVLFFPLLSIASAAKFDAKFDKSLLQEVLWPSAFLEKPEVWFPSVREEEDDGVSVEEPLFAPRPAVVKFPSRKFGGRFRRAAANDLKDVDEFFRSASKSEALDDLSDDKFWKEIELKAAADIEESQPKKALEPFSPESSSAKQATVAESIDGPLSPTSQILTGEKITIPASSLSGDGFVGSTPDTIFESSSPKSSIVSSESQFGGTTFTDWNVDTKDDFEAWLKQKGEPVPADLFETTTPTVPLPQPTTTTPQPEFSVDDTTRWTNPPPITTTTQEWTQPPVNTEPWTLPSTVPLPEPPVTVPWSEPPPMTTPVPGVHRPAVESLVPATVALPSTVVHFDGHVDPDFPIAPPRARGLHNVGLHDYLKGTVYPPVPATPLEKFGTPYHISTTVPPVSTPPTPPYVASYGRSDADLVASLVDNLPNQERRISPEASFPRGPPAPIDDSAPYIKPSYSNPPPNYSTSQPSYSNSLPSYSTSQPSYSNPSSSYSSPPASDSYVRPPLNYVERPQYETAPTVPVQYTRPSERLNQLPQLNPLPNINNYPQQTGYGNRGYGRPYYPQPQQSAYSNPQGYSQGASSSSGYSNQQGSPYSSQGGIILPQAVRPLDPNSLQPNYGGGLYLGQTQTHLYSNPVALSNTPTIVGNNGQFDVGTQHLFTVDPNAPTSTWRGQSLAPYLNDGRLTSELGSGSGTGSAAARAVEPVNWAAVPPKYPFEQRDGAGATVVKNEQAFVQSALSILEESRRTRGRRSTEQS